jgi:hypothetical protein
MPLSKLQFKPGINTEVTPYTNEGGWLDCDKVRFRFGFPEKLGGWTKYASQTFAGVCRSLHAWVASDNSKYMGVGTHLKFYIEEGGSYNDITPIRLTTTNTATFSAVNGSTTITVTDAGNEVILGDSVTFSGASGLGGNITADILNQEYVVASVVDPNNYTIEASVSANASDTGNGGGSVIAEYQINIGINTVVPGTGWGAGTYSRGTWGSAATTVAGGGSLRLWRQDNFGDDLLFNIRDGAIYYWDKSLSLTSRGVELTSLSSSAPSVARQIMVSDRDRHVLAFGCNPFGSSTQDKLLIRFSDQESLTDWEPTATNTAGDLLVGVGSEIIAAVETRREIIVITDESVHSVQFIGPPFTFGITQVSTGITIVGPNAAVAVNDLIFWMGRNRFYVYDGQVNVLPCTVRDTVFDDFDLTQGEKTYAAINSEFGEVTWFYSSNGSSVNDKYVTYNFVEKVWYYGTISRTAWIDRGIKDYPVGAAPNGYLYNHENGLDDDGSPMTAYIESSPIEIQDGESFALIRRLIPDISFLNSASGASKEATFTLKAEDFPGTGYTRSYASTVTDTDTQDFVRLRGRAVGLRVESTNLNMTWRLGSPRIDIRQDGRR